MWDAALQRTRDNVRILVAEDETIIRLDLRALLEHAGFEVCGEARDGAEAVELARSLQPDLAIMDVKMPRLDGIEAARRILEERPIPMLCSLYVGRGQSHAVEAGIYGTPSSRFRERDLYPPSAPATKLGVGCRGRIAGRGVDRPQGDRARQGVAHGRGPPRAGGARAPSAGEPAFGPAAKIVAALIGRPTPNWQGTAGPRRRARHHRLWPERPAGQPGRTYHAPG